MKPHLLIATGLFLSSTSLATAPVSCHRDLYAKLLQYYHPFHYTRGFAALEPHVFNAFKKAMQPYLARGVEPPVDTESRAQIGFGFDWLKEASERTDYPRFGSRENKLEPKEVRDQENRLHRNMASFVIEGKLVFFRKLDIEARKRLAADLLNEMLGTDITSKSQIAIINGEHGLLSTAVPGKHFPTILENESAYLEQQIKEGKVTKASAADARAFEFLVNNEDGHSGNFLIDEKGVLRVFDHNVCFGTQIPRYKESFAELSSLGITLPKQYTRTFAAKIRALTPEQIRKGLGAHLSARELEALLFRREIILADLNLRGDAALLP